MNKQRIKPLTGVRFSEVAAMFAALVLVLVAADYLLPRWAYYVAYAAAFLAFGVGLHLLARRRQRALRHPRG